MVNDNFMLQNSTNRGAMRQMNEIHEYPVIGATQ
jgi:hypothetical protein